MYFFGVTWKEIRSCLWTVSPRQDPLMKTIKRILHARYGDRNRMIQAHLNYLEEIKPIRFVSLEKLNGTFIECSAPIAGYARVLASKKLLVFPDDVCRRWIIHVKRMKLSEEDILQLMKFLGEEVEGVLVTQKIRGTSLSENIPSTVTLHVDSKSEKNQRKHKDTSEPFCVFCEYCGHWAQDCKTVIDVNQWLTKLNAFSASTEVTLSRTVTSRGEHYVPTARHLTTGLFVKERSLQNHQLDW